MHWTEDGANAILELRAASSELMSSELQWIEGVARLLERGPESEPSSVRVLPALAAHRAAQFLVAKQEGGGRQIRLACAPGRRVRQGEFPLCEVQVCLVRPDEEPSWNAQVR